MSFPTSNPLSSLYGFPPSPFCSFLLCAQLLSLLPTPSLTPQAVILRTCRKGLTQDWHPQSEGTQQGGHDGRNQRCPGRCHLFFRSPASPVLVGITHIFPFPENRAFRDKGAHLSLHSACAWHLQRLHLLHQHDWQSSPKGDFLGA